MSESYGLRELFDRWEQVWHEGRYDLIHECVAPVYVRHDESGTRTLTREEYATEIAADRKTRPNSRFVVYDHELANYLAWFRFTLMWNDKTTGESRTRAGMQLYRVDGGKLVETWLTLLSVGSAWQDVGRQDRWTSKRGTVRHAMKRLDFLYDLAFDIQ